jgi:ABC-type nitrate/sulfonate/bicarbonate transport system permease component
MGYLLSRSATQFSSSGVFASIAALLVISLIISRLVAVLTSRALRWKTRSEAID